MREDGRDWRDLRERLRDLAELADEMVPGLDVNTYRFLYAIIAPMAADAHQLALDLGTAIMNEAAENGISLPRLDLGGGDSGD